MCLPISLIELKIKENGKISEAQLSKIILFFKNKLLVFLTLVPSINLFLNMAIKQVQLKNS